MKKSLLLLSALLAVGMTLQAKVAYLVPAGDTELNSLPYEHYIAEADGINKQFEQSPERRAWLWFNEVFVESGRGQFICFTDLAAMPDDIQSLWIYVDRVGFDAAAFDALFADYIDELQTFVNNGGNVFLCKQATRLEKDLVGATDAGGNTIVPDYNFGDYQGAATWGVDYRFEFGNDVVWSNADHPIYSYAPYRDENYAELIWTNGGMITDHNCGIGIGAMDMSSITDADGLATFQNRNNCKVLGCWANGDGCHYGGVIEFYPVGNRKGTVLFMGLAAYSWINNNGGFGWANTQAITRSALMYLDAQQTTGQYRVAYLLPAFLPSQAGGYDGEQPERNAANWFRDTYVNTDKQGCFITVEELPKLAEMGVKTLWVNIERVGISPDDAIYASITDALKAFVKTGGNVLLTKQATYLAYLIGRIDYAPALQSAEYVDDDRGQLRSMQTVMGLSDCVDQRLDMSGHQIFNNMLCYWDTKSMFFVSPGCRKTYNYCSWQDYFRAADEDTHYDNCLIQRVRDFEQDWSATVLAGQGGIGDYCLSNIIEFNATDDWSGRILTVGSAAYQWGTSNNSVERNNLTTLTANCLNYLLDEQPQEQLFTRSVAAGQWGTICFDYAVEAGNIQGADMYSIHSFNATGDSLILVKVDNMAPGQPYIYYSTGYQIQIRYSGTCEEAKRHNGLVGFIGWSDTDTYEVGAGKHVLTNNIFTPVEANIPYILTPRYAYVDAAEVPAYAQMPEAEHTTIRIVDAHPSAIDNMMNNIGSITGIYDIFGRRVSRPQTSGVYIINGQKTLITVP